MPLPTVTPPANNRQQKTDPIIAGLLIISLMASLACSVGTLVVELPTPTPTVYKTRRATYTATPFRIPTFTPSATPTPTLTFTPTPTPSETPMPTETPTPTETSEEVAAAAPQAQSPPTEPPPPTATPTPAEPTATPTPEFPFNFVYTIHDTGSPGETRMTGWIRVDYEPGRFRSLEGFQIKAIAPDGSPHYSEMSGPGTADSTVAGTGDNHPMNTKLEIRPYTPGTYKIMLVQNEVQVSPEIEINLSANPMQYVHFDFFRQGS